MRPRLLPVLTIAVLLPACRVTDVPFWGRKPTPSDACEVERIRDVSYYDGPGASALRHRADLFLPKGRTDYPVVVLVHGGAWMVGDNRCCGLYSAVGEYLASQGIGAVLPNYRLSPRVKHPEHIKDLARAFAWTKRHSAKFGGDPGQLFLVGHSAGGHLAALLTTDERYLKTEGCAASDIGGVVGVSGVYRILDGKAEVELGGTSERSLTLAELVPFRGDSKPRFADEVGKPGWPIRMNIFRPAFGDDPSVRSDASPVEHVRAGLPPFLLINAEHDLPLLPDMAVEMHRRLTECGCPSQHLTIGGRNHNSIIFQAITDDDPVARAIVRFVREVPAN